jgi:hypothetical protein
LISRRSARTPRLKREPSHNITHSIVNQQLSLGPGVPGKGEFSSAAMKFKGAATHLFAVRHSPQSFAHRVPRRTCSTDRATTHG